MRFLISIICVTILLGSCNSSNDATPNKNNTSSVQPSQGKDGPVDSPTEKLAGSELCYMKILLRDTLVVVLENTGNDIQGRLTFDNYQKDGSSGRVVGRQEGDVIKLLYSFASEGTNSVMEVYFKQKGDVLIRGVGEIETKGDTAYFTDPAKLQFPEDGAFKKMSCEEVPPKYK